MNDHRNEEAKARDAWLKTSEAKRPCAGSASGQYLRNRLVDAFLAGYEAKRIADALEEKREG